MLSPSRREVSGAEGGLPEPLAQSVICLKKGERFYFLLFYRGALGKAIRFDS